MDINRVEQIEGLLLSFHNAKQKLACHGNFLHAGPDITFSQWVALDFVGKNKKCSIDEISKALHVSSSAATQLVNGLYDKGLVIKKTGADDRRVTLIEPSVKAKRFFNSMEKKKIIHIKKLFSAFSDRELKTFIALMKKITASVSK